MGRVKEIVIISGKGGTGKTTIAAGFADLSSGSVFCDCDVEAANLELVLNPVQRERHEFVATSKAFINPNLCAGRGLCESACRFGAITQGAVDQLSCEGCGLCSRICPSGAIEMRTGLSGHWFISDTPKGPLVHARLGPGGENSGRLVTLVRQEARRLAEATGRDRIVTDGPPGIGCPVIASLSGADLAVAVTEPSLSGIHDLLRVAEVCRRFSVPVALIINKYDIHEHNSRDIMELSRREGLRVIGRVPYDSAVPKAMAAGNPVTRYDTPAAEAIKSAWQETVNISQ